MARRYWLRVIVVFPDGFCQPWDVPGGGASGGKLLPNEEMVTIKKLGTPS